MTDAERIKEYEAILYRILEHRQLSEYVLNRIIRALPEKPTDE